MIPNWEELVMKAPGGAIVRGSVQSSCDAAKAAIRQAGGNWDQMSCDQIANEIAKNCCLFGNPANPADQTIRRDLAPGTCFLAPQNDYCQQAKLQLKALDSKYCTADCTTIKNAICNDPNLFIGQPAIRTWAGCGAAGCSHDCASCRQAGNCCAGECGTPTSPNLVPYLLVGLAAVVGVALAINKRQGA
jgi:hypothetical protein